jgi:hypothetical protein
MILTDEEKRMRDGAEGAATAAAMDLLIRYGDALACDRLCDVRNVAGTMTQPSPVKERLVREGGWDKAFAVINLDCDTDIEVPAMRVPMRRRRIYRRRPSHMPAPSEAGSARPGGVVPGVHRRSVKQAPSPLRHG